MYNMALLSSGKSNDLVQQWLNELGADEVERQAVTFYTLIHCVTFMGENGMTFNKESKFSEEYHQKLDTIFNRLISEIT